MKKDENVGEQSFEGCYGSQVTYDQLDCFIQDSFQSNRDSEESGCDERFATCIWGHAGCVLGDTEIEVRKIGEGKHHNIIVVNPIPE